MHICYSWLATDQEELVIIEAVSNKHQQLTVPFQEKKWFKQRKRKLPL